ncbi:MAG TPA: lysylphosphatidylglycerol synthase domain-containing protein, partial [Pseudonocardiaceae bacterium]|nr:lysylphosphatidylglycerol synthase domain-containing protein [Pseudonocardiaceae bacterium]
ALLIAFMLGAAAGSAVPVPAGLGSTEAALIAVLISVHIPAQHAVEEVLIFRLLTFWAPAAVGILATRVLYRSRAL